MKLLPPCIPLLLLSALFAYSGDIELGQSQQQVEAAIGKPVGQIDLRDKTLLLFPQGEVTIKDGIVSHIDLMDPDAFSADQERLKKEREEWLADQANREAARIEEGKALRDEKMTSNAFAALPAKDRVDYWRSFQMRYPEIDVAEQIATALAGYETEKEELRTQQQIAELEERVAKAEKNTAEARLETERLKTEANEAEKLRNSFSQYYTTPIYTDRRYYYRAPTIRIFTPNSSANKPNIVVTPRH